MIEETRIRLGLLYPNWLHLQSCDEYRSSRDIEVKGSESDSSLSCLKQNHIHGLLYFVRESSQSY